MAVLVIPETNYYATAKLDDGTIHRFSYSARGVVAAIDHMEKLLGLTDSECIDEFEIMEVLDKDSYRPVASRLPKSTRERFRTRHAMTVVTPPTAPVQPKDYWDDWLTDVEAVDKVFEELEYKPTPVVEDTEA